MTDNQYLQIPALSHQATHSAPKRSRLILAPNLHPQSLV